MSEVEVIRSYYDKVVAAGFPHSRSVGDERPRLRVVDESGCHADGQNLLFLCFDVDDGVLRNVAYGCEYCDVTMYVTAELLSERLNGEHAATVAQISDDSLVTALGGHSGKVIRQARMALRILAEAIT